MSGQNCIITLSVSSHCLYQNTVCIRTLSVSEHCLYHHTVCIRTLSVSEHSHRNFQSDFSTQCYLLRPLFYFQYPLVSLRSFNSCLRLLPPLPVTYIPPFISPSVTCFRTQFLQKMWPIHLTFFILICLGLYKCIFFLI